MAKEPIDVIFEGLQVGMALQRARQQAAMEQAAYNQRLAEWQEQLRQQAEERNMREQALELERQKLAATIEDIKARREEMALTREERQQERELERQQRLQELAMRQAEKGQSPEAQLAALKLAQERAEHALNLMLVPYDQYLKKRGLLSQNGEIDEDKLKDLTAADRSVVATRKILGELLRNAMFTDNPEEHEKLLKQAEDYHKVGLKRLGYSEEDAKEESENLKRFTKTAIFLRGLAATGGGATAGAATGLAVAGPPGAGLGALLGGAGGALANIPLEMALVPSIYEKTLQQRMDEEKKNLQAKQAAWDEEERRRRMQELEKVTEAFRSQGGSPSLPQRER
jgi:hypothetical protein